MIKYTTEYPAMKWTIEHTSLASVNKFLKEVDLTFKDLVLQDDFENCNYCKQWEHGTREAKTLLIVSKLRVR